MAELSGSLVTLSDIARKSDGNGIVDNVIELLAQSNMIMEDIPWMETNKGGGEHLTTLRTSLPTAYYRLLNRGIPNSKTGTAQVTETCAQMRGRTQIDKTVAQLSGNVAKARADESAAMTESFSQTLATNLFYANNATDPEKFLGFTPRFNAISGATSGQNILTGGGSGSDNTSVWLIGWGPRKVFGLYPKGTQAGMTHISPSDASDGCVEVADSDGNRFRAFVDEYEWNHGLAVEDWRYVVRIPNIDVSALIAESSAADLVKLMSRALDRIPNFANVKLVFYANRTVTSMLRIQALGKSAGALSVEDALTQFGTPFKETRFLGVPIRTVDSLSNSEAAIT